MSHLLTVLSLQNQCLVFLGPNQVQTFLTEHGGPGIQHIGLHTPDITQAVAALKENGVAFIDPPAAYYSEVCCTNVVVLYLFVVKLAPFTTQSFAKNTV